MSQSVTIRELKNKDIGVLAELYRQSVPNAVLNALGRKFTEQFFGYLAERAETCAAAAVNEEGDVIGVIVGTLNRRKSYRGVVRRHFGRLLDAAGWRVVSPRLMMWIVRGLLQDLKRVKREKSLDLPDAELLFIAVRPKARGTGLSDRLVEHMEDRFRETGFSGEYAILTEARNTRANRFYNRLGALFCGTADHHGISINCYRKSIH